jgi:hypothetical protein
VVILVGLLWTGRPPDTLVTPPSGTPTRTIPLTAVLSSFDPSGGSGFRQQSATVWRTQTYRSEQFGNLKPGVGLVLDLGTAQSLTAITLDAGTGPLTLELRAADTAATNLAGYPLIGAPRTSSGATTLPAGGGPHRYWMIWVTRLGPQGDGFGAQLSNPVAVGLTG